MLLSYVKLFIRRPPFVYNTASVQRTDTMQSLCVLAEEMLVCVYFVRGERNTSHEERVGWMRCNSSSL